MNHTEYLKIKDKDTALAVRTAVTMGWTISCYVSKGLIGVRDGFVGYTFNPFTDASIPYGLIGYGLVEEIGYDFDGLCYAEAFVRTEDSSGRGWVKRVEGVHESKTRAILNAFCAADPSGHWAKFIGEVK